MDFIDEITSSILKDFNKKFNLIFKLCGLSYLKTELFKSSTRLIGLCGNANMFKFQLVYSQSF